ncbi:MAG: GAF domain-containing protein [Thermoplasmatales archaeon]|nr:GAF domain-containing protein [Thermoplasmatales archaeon]
MKKIFKELIEEIEGILSLPIDKNSKLERICILLKEKIHYYNWVGFYFAKNGNLILGPFCGDETEHKIIPFGKGICGQVAESKNALIVQDITKEKNYLACSRKVKAEIVVPIIRDGEFLGEIDIDSHYISPFNSDDEEFLKEVCKIVAKII